MHYIGGRNYIYLTFTYKYKIYISADCKWSTVMPVLRKLTVIYSSDIFVPFKRLVTSCAIVSISVNSQNMFDNLSKLTPSWAKTQKVLRNQVIGSG